MEWLMLWGNGMWNGIGRYSFWGGAFLFAPLLLLLFPFLILYDFITGRIGKSNIKTPPPTTSAVLITGCDSGFGHELAIKLSESGWKVYAGCLTTQGQELLTRKANHPFIIPVKMVWNRTLLWSGWWW